MNEVYFPRTENTATGIGSCYYINHDGKTRFHETNNICLDSSNSGSLRSPFSKRDPEYHLLNGAMNFLYITGDSSHRFASIFTRIIAVTACII